jgi:hypothetical protein
MKKKTKTKTNQTRTGNDALQVFYIHTPHPQLILKLVTVLFLEVFFKTRRKAGCGGTCL